MRFRTFRWVVRGAIVAAVAGLGIWYVTRPKPIPPVLPKPEPTPVAAPAPAPDAAPAPRAEGVPLRPGDIQVLEALKRPLDAGSGKDAVKSSGWKVNLYQDPGKTSINRL